MKLKLLLVLLLNFSFSFVGLVFSANIYSSTKEESDDDYSRTISFSDNNNRNGGDGSGGDSGVGYHDFNNEYFNDHKLENSRKGKFFPFYTIGRFQNTQCTGINQLSGTCVLGEECADAGGIATGNCSTLTKRAVCCVYQSTCGETTDFNNTYFVNPGYPASWTGGSGCSLTVKPCSSGVCQLRIDFLDLSLAPPNGDGFCNTDVLSITGGSTRVPNLCGENTGQHVYVDFAGTASITIRLTATAAYTFSRNWHMKVTQINCESASRAPSGCLQYHFADSGVVRSFNYNPSANSLPNTVGVEGTRQLANLAYGICIRKSGGQCSITWSTLASDIYSFTLTGDVGAVDPTLLGTSSLQEQNCNTDYIIIPNPSQNNQILSSDRFCGLGLATTTSNASPFVLYVVTDGSETMDIGNRGFALAYSQSPCPVI